MSKVTRRGFLKGVGAASGGAALAAGGYVAGSSGGGSDSGAPVQASVVPFYGTHQAGIATPAQDRLLFASFDLTDGMAAGDLKDLFKQWTSAADLMSRGAEVGSDDNLRAPPEDTGEANGLPPSRLTMTFGFGPSLFVKQDTDRFGIAGKRPEALVDIPPFPFDALDLTLSNGDIGVQVCADDPVVAFHAVRNLSRVGRGKVVLRWSQMGFGRTSTTSVKQSTPRNLQGFKDGTNNIKLEDVAGLNEHVWVGTSDQPPWMRGGSYMVTRRIRMLIEVWDRTTLDDQERTIGRSKLSGAPLGGTAEFDTPDLNARGGNAVNEHGVKDGMMVPADSHIRLASPLSNDGAKLLRRGYSFTDGADSVTGQLDAGLFFIAYQRDPRKQFIPVQRRLASNDALNEYIKHVGSAIFACPPGIKQGETIGQSLFA